MGQSVLLVDSQSDQLVVAAEFLLRRECKVETLTDGLTAIETIRRRQQAKRPYDLIIANLKTPGEDGLAIAREALRLHRATRCYLSCQLEDLDPTTKAEAERAGILGFLDVPIELGALLNILAPPEQAGALEPGKQDFRHRTPPTMPVEELPFYEASPAPATASVRRSESESHRHAAGSGGHRRPSESGAQHTSTARRRRRTQAFTQDAGTTPEATTTSRIRRGVTGTINRDGANAPGEPLTAGSKQASCMHCGGRFVVARKAESYSLPCIHCGRINSIAGEG